MPLLRDGRPLKRWRYVGVYGPDLMLCAATVRIAGIPQAFWAVLDRETGALADRTAFTPGPRGDRRRAPVGPRARRRGRPGAATRGRADGGHQPARRVVHLDPQGPDPRRRARHRERPHPRDRPCRADRRVGGVPRSRDRVALVGRRRHRDRRPRARVEPRHGRPRRGDPERADGLGGRCGVRVGTGDVPRRPRRGGLHRAATTVRGCASRRRPSARGATT